MTWVDALLDFLESHRTRRPYPGPLLPVRVTNMQRMAVIREIEALHWELERYRAVAAHAVLAKYTEDVQRKLKAEGD